jgi:hypothetical protein
MNDSDISDLARMLPVPAARDFQAGRQQTLREHLMTEFRIAGDHHRAGPLQPRPVLNLAARKGSGRLGTPLQRRWLVPLTAAVAVLAVIVGALVVSNAVPTQRKPPAAPIQTRVPPYYVSLTSVRPLPLRQPHSPFLPATNLPASFFPLLTTATVRATSTGAAIARINPPKPYTYFLNVSAASDDRTFVLAAQYGTLTGPVPHVQVGFFMLRIKPTATDPAARATLAALPAAALPYDHVLESMALSPDGRLLATVAVDRSKAQVPPDYLRVYNLATGRARTWSGVSSPNAGLELPGTGEVQWLQDGRFLAVRWGHSTIPDGSPEELRLLNVNARGSSLARDSKPVADLGWACAVVCTTDTTPDGKTVFVAYMTTSGRGIILARFNVPTGTRTRVNKLTIEVKGRYTRYDLSLVPPDGVLWTSYNGSQVIVANVLRGVPNAGIYDGSHYTPIPWPANTEYAAW